MLKKSIVSLAALLAVCIPVTFGALSAAALPANAVEINDPTTGVLLGSQTISMTGTADFTPTSSPLGGVSGCGIIPSVPHAYTLLPFTVSTTGTYTFRVVSSSPSMVDGSDSDPYEYQPYYSNYPSSGPDLMPPTGDLMMALYDNSINTTTPNVGVLGCNDDSDAADTAYTNGGSGVPVYSMSGQYLNMKFPEFTINNLAAGDYTILLTTWAAGYDSASWSNKGYGTQSATFEFWGPQGGITSGILPEVVQASSSVSTPELAKTGAPFTQPWWATQALLITGGALVFLVRASARASTQSKN